MLFAVSAKFASLDMETLSRYGPRVSNEKHPTSIYITVGQLDTPPFRRYQAPAVWRSGCHGGDGNWYEGYFA